VKDLKSTTISIQLDDRLVKYPIGVLEDVPIVSQKLFIPYDFVVIEMVKDAQIPIILGIPYLVTAGAMIE